MSSRQHETKGKIVKVYIAGKMTGEPLHGFPAFFAAESVLRAAGHEVVNPARNDGGDSPVEAWNLARKAKRAGATWLDYMRRDIKALADCDAIALLPGWHDSRGACLESDIAKRLGLATVSTSTGRVLHEGVQ